MTQTVKVKWRGREVLALIQEGTLDGLFAAGETLLEAAAAKTPYKTGALRDSGYVSSKQRSTYKNKKGHRKEIKPDGDNVIVGFAMFYAKFWELGTRKLPARPFLRPALDEQKERLLKIMAGETGKVLK